MGVEVGRWRDPEERPADGGPWGHARPAIRRFSGGMEAETQAYADILRRRWPLIRNVFLAVLGLGLLFALFQDRTYRASALVEVRGGEPQVPSVDRLFADEEASDEQFQTRLGLLRSTTLASRVVDEMRLDTLEAFSGGGDAEPSAIVRAFLDRLVVDPVEESRLVRVSFDAESPELAAEIVNTILRAHADLARGSRGQAAERLAMQVDSVETRLERSEEELRAYARANDLPYSPEEDLTAQIAQRLRDLRQQLADAQAERYESESRYDMVVREGRVDLVEDPVQQELSLRLAELRENHARLSATFTDQFPATAEARREIEELEALITEEEGRIADGVESDYRLALQRERTISEAITEMERQANELGPASGTYHVLRQAVMANRALYASLHERQREAEIASAVGETALRVVDEAVPPLEPYQPTFGMNLALTLMLGMVLAIGAAFVKEMFDDTVQNAEDLRTRGQPVLAMIPAMQPPHEHRSSLVDSARRAKALLPWPNGETTAPARAEDDVGQGNGASAEAEDGAAPPTTDDGAASRRTDDGVAPPNTEDAAAPRTEDGAAPPEAKHGESPAENGNRWPRIDVRTDDSPGPSALADAFGALRTAVLFENGDSLPRSILVSSCLAGEGKSTISVNLAMSLASLKDRILLIDADLRRPSVHTILAAREKPGLRHYLAGDVDWRPAVQRGVVNGVDVLTSGGPTTLAGDLLSNGRFPELLREAEERYSFVIVDAPALFINASDAKLLGRHADGVVVVVRSRSTPRSLVDRIPEEVPKLLGVVLNDLDRSSLPNYFGEYYGYDDPDTAGGVRERGRKTEHPLSRLVSRIERLVGQIGDKTNDKT